MSGQPMQFVHWNSVLTLIFFSLAAVLGKPGFLLTTQNTAIPGGKHNVCITFTGVTSNIVVDYEFRRLEKSSFGYIYAAGHAEFSAAGGCKEFALPVTLPTGSLELSVNGYSKFGEPKIYQFSGSTTLKVVTSVPTDKPVYKPGQTVACDLEPCDNHRPTFWKNITSEIAQMKEDLSAAAIDLMEDVVALNYTVRDTFRMLNNSQDAVLQQLKKIEGDLQTLKKYTVRHECQFPFVRYGQACYWFSAKSVSQNVAEDTCNALNGSLLITESLNEDEFVNRQMFLHDIHVTWMGLKLTDRHKLYNPSGAHLSYTNWLIGEPINGGNAEYCVEFRRILTKNDCELHYKELRRNCDENFSERRRWNDRPCSALIPFICKFTL